MSKCQIFVGSPRKKGNSNVLADMLINNYEDKNIKFEKSFLYDTEISPCIDCRVCKNAELICNRKDGMKEYYDKMEAAEIIIVSTPIYWYGPTGKTKLFIDRLRPYYGNKKLAGKKLGLLLPSGVGEKDCDLTITMFKRICEALKMEYIGAVTVEAYDEGDVKSTDFLPDLESFYNQF